MRSLRASVLCLCLAALAGLPELKAEPPTPPGSPFNAPLPPREALPKSTATRLASLSPGQCSAELKKRGIKSKRAGRAAPGVATPLRLDGPLQGVRFVTPGQKSPYGILDCRLALALDQLSVMLVQRGVTDVRVDNMYRPKAKLPGRHKPSQHSYGLAIDIYGFTLSGGKKLDVEADWHGDLGTPPCGPESKLTDTCEEALSLRNLF